mgnify:CR=1
MSVDFVILNFQEDENKSDAVGTFVVSFPGNPCAHWDEKVRFWHGKTGVLSIVTI